MFINHNYNYKYMPQAIVYIDNVEDIKVKEYSEKWKLSKAESIKKMIREFKEECRT